MKIFEKPELKINELSSAEIITTSPGGMFDPQKPGEMPILDDE